VHVRVDRGCRDSPKGRRRQGRSGGSSWYSCAVGEQRVPRFCARVAEQGAPLSRLSSIGLGVQSFREREAFEEDC
jgi:hypothetical protein